MILLLCGEETVLGRVRVGLVFGVWVLLLFVAVFGVVLNVPVVLGSGTIYIRADGSIEPPTAPISSLDNITYTFTSDIYDEIVVERSHIVIDGNAYTLQGSENGNGFYWTDINNANNIYGIYISFSSNNSISGNNINKQRVWHLS
jgi:hypothetical protein